MAMGEAPQVGCCGITRRGLLLGAAAGLAGVAPLGWLGLRAWQGLDPASAKPQAEISRAAYGMPGRFPGRVIEVRRADVVNANWRINADAVNAMIDRGMTALTGADDPSEAWKRFFGPGDIVGIKVNPVGRKPKPTEADRVRNAVGSISSPEVLLKIVAELKASGIKPGNIIVFERYAEEFIDAGYADVMYERVMDGV